MSKINTFLSKYISNERLDKETLLPNKIISENSCYKYINQPGEKEKIIDSKRDSSKRVSEREEWIEKGRKHSNVEERGRELKNQVHL